MTSKIFEVNDNNPLEIFRIWLKEAEAAEINDPEAACLATADAAGQPSARMVLVKDFDDNGFKFHTNAESRKGHDLAENPQAALCFYWKSLRRQVCARGTVSETTPTEADEYFATRPLGRQIGAWASDQSRPLESREKLEQRAAAVEEKYKGGIIPRPPYWKGYRLRPDAIEFWLGDENRLHDRFVFERQAGGSWNKAQRLYP